MNQYDCLPVANTAKQVLLDSLDAYLTVEVPMAYLLPSARDDLITKRVSYHDGHSVHATKAKHLGLFLLGASFEKGAVMKRRSLSSQFRNKVKECLELQIPDLDMSTKLLTHALLVEYRKPTRINNASAGVSFQTLRKYIFDFYSTCRSLDLAYSRVAQSCLLMTYFKNIELPPNTIRFTLLTSREAN